MRKGSFYFFGLLSLTGLSAFSQAVVFNLTDTNTSAVIDTSAGIQDWNVLGTDQVFLNSYLWRVGDSGTADWVTNLSLVSATQFGPRFLDVAWQNASLGFTVQTSFLLSGGATTFDMAEVTRVTNTGNNTLNFRLFQYNDFDLNNTLGDDTVTRLNSSQIMQQDGALTLNMVNQGATPIPGFSQLGPVSSFVPMISINGYNLDTLAGNGIGQNFTGDAAYGFQWNFNLAPGQSFTISTDKVAAVPEPATMAALGLGALALVRRRRNKK